MYVYVDIIIKIDNAVKVLFFVSSWYLMCIDETDGKVLPKIINCIYPYLQRKASSEGNSKSLHYCVRWNRQKVASEILFFLHRLWHYFSASFKHPLLYILSSQGYCFRFNIKQVQNNDCGCGKMSQNGSFKDSLCVPDWRLIWLSALFSETLACILELCYRWILAVEEKEKCWEMMGVFI